MRGINDLVRRAQEAPREPVDDLVNGEHKICECGQPGCGSPLIIPKAISRV